MKKLFEKPKTVQDWVDLVFQILGALLVVAYFILFFIASGKATDATLPEKSLNFWKSFFLFSPTVEPNPWIRSVSLAFFILAVSFVVRIFLRFVGQFMGKGRAIVNLIASLIKYGAVIVLIFMILRTFGVDTTTLIVSAGVVSLIIGLGCQSLISDVIAGLFIVFEEVFNIGDIIVIDGFRGTVKEIGVRTTQIMDWGGNIKVVNNSDIRSLVNMTSELSAAFVQVEIEYGESIERVEAVIKENLDRIRKNVKDIVNGPNYLGVADLGASGVKLSFIAQCKENVRFQVERDIRRELKLIFDENDIGIPFTQITINQPKEFQAATKKDVKASQEFLQEQKESTKDISIDTDQLDK